MNTRLQPYLLMALGWVICFTSSAAFAQNGAVFEGTLTLTTQAEVDAFDYTSVNNLVINARRDCADPITDLKALCSLVTVENNLTIEGGTQLTSLKGLHELKTVGRFFTLRGTGVKSFDGLGALASIGLLEVVGTKVESFRGLSSLRRINGDLIIESSYQLTNFRGLDNIQQVSGIIYLNDTRIASFEGLDNLEIVGALDFDGSFRIDDFTGLTSLELISAYVSVDSIRSGIRSFRGLEDVERIGDIFVNRANLPNFDGLRSLRSVGSISVESSQLISFEGIETLEEVEDSILIDDNDRLLDISALSGVQQLGTNLTVTNNRVLSDCCVIPALQAIVSGEIILENNAPECSNLEAIQENCDEPVTGTDCSQETITLTTQAEVDAFDCTSVKNLVIEADGSGASPITNLKALGSLESVTNNLTISGFGSTQLTTLEGLHSLTSVGGNLRFSLKIANPEGLSSLKTIGGSLEAYESGLQTFEGLESLTSIGGQLYVYRTPLVSFKGLNNLETTQGALLLSNIGISADGIVPNVSFEGLSSLTSVGGIIFDDQYVAAQNFQGLTSLKTIRGDLRVSGTDGLSVGSLTGLEKVEEITGSIIFSYERFKDFQGLNNVKRIGGNIDLEDNQIESFDGLENVEEIGGQIQTIFNKIKSVKGLQSLRTVGGINIQDEPLASLDGLQQLQQVNGSLNFSYTRISDVSPLSNIEFITGNLTLEGNQSLTECCIVPSLLERVEGKVVLEDNGEGCNSLEEIVVICNEPLSCRENIVIKTQAEIDAFTCSYVAGDLTISGEDSEDPIRNLSSLLALDSVGGTLKVSAILGVKTSAGFDNLVKVKGSLLIENNSFETLSGFSNLQYVGENVNILENDLTSIQALASVSLVGGDLTIASNANLSECCIVPVLFDVVQGEVLIESNDQGCRGLDEVYQSCEVTIACQEENIILETQAEVNVFRCTEVKNLTVIARSKGVNRITDLNPLSSLVSVDGNLTIYNGNPQLTSLTGFDNLRTVGGNLTITDSISPDFTGFGNLEDIGGTFFVYESRFESFKGLKKLSSVGSVQLRAVSIETFQGLNNLERVEGRFEIRRLSNAANFDGLQNLSAVEGDLLILDSNIGSFEGLSRLTKVGGVQVLRSYNITDFTGLEALETITGSIDVYDQDDDIVSFQGLNNVIEIGGSISVTGSSSISNFQGLNQLRTIGGIGLYGTSFVTFEGLERLEIVQNTFYFDSYQLISLEALKNLKRVGTLSIFAPSLSSLNGLQSLTTITDDLFITSNYSLTDISALENVQRIGGNLDIESNIILTACCIIPSLLEVTEGSIKIVNNGAGCSSRAEIVASCAEEITEENTRTAQDLHAYPNPSENFVQIRVDQPTLVRLFNTTGYLVKEQRIEQEGTLDLTTVSAGVYLLKAPGRKVQRIIKK